MLSNSYKVLFQTFIFLLPLLFVLDIFVSFILTYFISWRCLIPGHLLSSILIGGLIVPPIISTERLEQCILLKGPSWCIDPLYMLIFVVVFNWVLSGTKSGSLQIMVDTHPANSKNSSRLIRIILIWCPNTLFHRLWTVSNGLCQIISVGLMDLRLTILFTLRIRVSLTSLNADQILGLLRCLLWLLS